MKHRRGKKARAIIEILEKRQLGGESALTAREIHDELDDGTAISSTHAALARLVEDGDAQQIGTIDVESGHSAAQFALKQGMALQQDLFATDATPALRSIFGDEPQTVPSLAAEDADDSEGDKEPDMVQRMAVYAARIATYENRRDSLRRAARKLVSVNPRVLVSYFLFHLIETFRKGAQDLKSEGSLTPGKAKQLRGKLMEIKEVFEDVARTLGIPKHVVELKASPGRGGRFAVDSDLTEADMHEALEAHIKTVVFGDYVLNPIDDDAIAKMEERVRTVTSSDGSTHPLTLSGISRLQKEYEESSALMFNNAAGVYTFVRRVNGKLTRQTDGEDRYRFLPLSRQHIQRGIPEGILMAPFMFTELDDSQYMHMLRFVPDNIQLQMDLNLLTSSEEYRDGVGSRPVPNVHIRDGMGVPYERGFYHFIEHSSYGKHARTGIRRYYEILKNVTGALSLNQLLVVTGAVKEARLRFFAYLIDWFISKGSELICPDADGEPIDVEWSEVSPITLTDNKAVANLMAATREVFPEQRFTSFRVRREFSSIAEPNRPEQKDANGKMRPVSNWESFLDRRVDDKIKTEEDEGNKEYREFAENFLDITPFVQLCEQADVTLFYTSDTGGSPAYTLPRYEFVNNLKTMEQTQREAEIENCVNAILAGIRISGGVDLDKDHNFMRSPADRMLIIEPVIMIEAHNAVKHSGNNIAKEITEAIYSSVSKMLKMDLRARLEIRPISFEQYRQIDRRFYEGLARYSKSELDPAVRERLRSLSILE